MILKSHRKFDKQFEKLSPKLQKKTRIAIGIFIKDPFDPVLRNHALHGIMQEERAFCVTGDVRIIFQEFDDYTIVFMLEIGTHNQIYK